MRSLVPDRPVELVGRDVEIGLYPSDISIAGKRLIVARARAAIATRLTGTAAWMTTSAEAQAIESRLEAITAAKAPGGTPGTAREEHDPGVALASLRAIDRELATLAVPQEEWEILARQRLQIERDLLAGFAPGSVLPTDGRTAAPRAALRAGGRAGGRPERTARLAPGIAAVAGVALVLADLAVAILDRRRH
jgi:hypothetical protein